jgi:quercetin dioxygenase-like cupin family protein
MKLIKKSEGHPDTAPGHTGQWGLTKLAAGKDTQRITFIISHFLPGGGLQRMAAPAELIYYGVKGELLVKGKDGEFTIKPGDALYIAAGEEREFKALGDETSTILVVASPNPK